MKTKNIFRMLLVAAALLMGANNVKADTETTIWEGTFDENGAVQINYDTQWYNGLNTNDKLRVYLSNRQVLLYGSYSTYIPFVNAPDGHIDFTSFTTTETGGYFDAVFTQESASTVNSWPDAWGGGQELKVKIGSDLTATQIDYIDASGNVIKNLANNLTLTNNNEISFNAALFNNLAQGKGVRIYVVLNDNIGKIRPYCNSSNVNLLSSSDGFVNCTKQEAIRGYKDITLTSDMKDLLKSNLSLCFGHNGIGIKKVSVITSGSSSKTTPTLTFPQSTYNITYGDSFTGPIATCDVSDLEVRYETSNRSVADVVYLTGEVEIKGAGQAVITARTEASSNYNVATASYTINVAKINYPLSYSASTATAVLGQSWTAPTLNNPSNISVTYSSTNTGVATINQNGTVTLVGAGQTTIKANYAGDNNHEAKEASYVLTVSTPQPTISFSQASYTTTFGEAFTAPVPTVYPAGSSVVYTSSNKNVAIVHNNTVIPVGTGAKDASYGETTITATLADNSNISATYTLRVNAPTAPQGATSVGAIWLGQYGDQGNGGLQPQLSISQYFSARESGGQIRFYGKVGPLNENSYWRVEIVDPSWSSPRLYEAQGNGLTNGYFAVDVNNVNLSGIDYIILNGTNITITAVQVVAPATQTYTATAASTSNGTVSINPTSGLAEGDVVTITATPATDYEVGSVSVTYGTNGSITPNSIGNNQYTFNMPAANVTVTVTFNEIETANGEFDAVNMGDYAYRTYVTPCAINFSRSVGVEAYCATSYDEQSVTFTQVTGTCNAGVPVLLKKKTGAEEFKLWKLTDEDATGNTPSTNYLVAGPATVHSANKYVLTVHSGVVVFAETNFQSATVDASHAYLYLHNTNAARGRLTIRLNGESTGISSLQSDEPSLDGAVYNLRGQRVEHPTKGLYIINGKKVVIK